MYILLFNRKKIEIHICIPLSIMCSGSQTVGHAPPTHTHSGSQPDFPWLVKTHKLIAEEEHVLSLLESKAEPHMHNFLGVVQTCLGSYWPGEGKARPPEWSRSYERGSQQMLQNLVSPIAKNSKNKIMGPGAKMVWEPLKRVVAFGSLFSELQVV